MPTPLSARLNRDRDNVLQPSTSTSAYTTPIRSKSPFHTSSTRTSTSYTPTVISSGQQQQKLNVVTRVAIEGRAKQGQDGATVKIYLKIAVPLDSVNPGMTIPLFPEENVKILSSQIHPLDNNSTPYNFSSTLSPLLHNAARALNLPARSVDTFESTFQASAQSAPSAIRNSLSTNGTHLSSGEDIPPVDEQFTGHILVSGYSVSLVLPRTFPSRKGLQSDGEGESLSRSAFRGRRPSIGERNLAHFMAAIDMWVPYVSRPPRHPYLLSIPTPRCLHNNIRLRIFPPTTTSSSLASLSSIDDDSGTWDLTSEPHVTRTSLRARSNSYTHFADDESSDSSTTGFPDGCGIQGTFPSAEHIRIRWAKPIKNIDVPGVDDGRRRVGVREVRSEMTCTVKGKAKHKERPGVTGVILELEYKATCKGIWFPGVATLLGMDIGLEAKGSDVFWVNGHASEWEVSGGTGYTGYNVGFLKHLRGLAHNASMDSNGPPENSPGPPSDFLARTDSNASSTSLLRAPLPGQSDVEYSFEGSNINSVTSTAGTVSTLSSLDQSSNEVGPTTPGRPITLHLNLNEIISPSKNTFQFTISGTILVVPRPNVSRASKSFAEATNDSLGQKELETDPIALPSFTVLAADSESTTMHLCNDIDGIPLPVVVHTGAGGETTGLQKGSTVKCPREGAKIVLRFPATMVNGIHASPNRSQTPEAMNLARQPSTSSPRRLFSSQLRKDGPLLLPTIQATITPLVQADKIGAPGYAIHLTFTSPVNTESEHVEFGLGRMGEIDAGPSQLKDIPPKVDIVSATIGGIPVKCNATPLVQSEGNMLGIPFGQMDKNGWVMWVKLPVGTTGGETVAIDYVVLPGAKSKPAKTRKSPLEILLPSFHLPVGRFEVVVEGIKVSSVRSNFAYMLNVENKCKLLIFSVERFFYPKLSFNISPEPTQRNNWTISASHIIFYISWILLFCACATTYRLTDRLMDISQRADTASPPVYQEPTEAVTITSTVFITTSTQRWRDESAEPTATLIQCNPTSTTSSFTPPAGHRPHPTTDQNDQAPDSTSYAYELLPLQHVFTFRLPSFSAEDWQETYDHLKKRMERVWQIFRRVYHYPLDPP